VLFIGDYRLEREKVRAKSEDKVYKMTQVTPIRDFKGYFELKQAQKRLIDASKGPREKAFIAVLGRSAIQISEAIQLEESNIDFERGTLTIVHLKERLKLKCPNCGEILGKRHIFCPSCGNKVDQAIREKVEQRRQRMIPVDRDTLRLLDEYLKWRRHWAICFLASSRPSLFASPSTALSFMYEFRMSWSQCINSCPNIKSFQKLSLQCHSLGFK
jgi:integrase